MNSFRIKKIRRLNLGSKLKECRLEKELSLEQVYQQINIPVRYLEALEEEKWKNLPGEIYLKKFLDKYCHFLKLNFSLCFRQYQKQIRKEKSIFRPKSSKKKLKERMELFFNFFTPRRFNIILLLIILVFLLGYLSVKINDYISPPDLIITYPLKNFETSDNLIVIKGQTKPEAEVFVNGENVSVEEDGSFKIDVKLKFGLNKFNITSQREHGRKNQKEIMIFKKQISQEKN